MSQINRIPLTEKYRPQTFLDLVLPSAHGLAPAIQFLCSPARGRFMLIGKSGLGKTSLARIMASVCSHPLSTQHLVGPDVDSHKAKELTDTCRTRPLWGRYHCYIIDEADAIPKGGQIRLLSALEDTTLNAVWICTSNEDAESWESRFLSRFTVMHFTNQRIAEPATKWLLRIAGLEGLPLNADEAERIIRNAKNNLRDALQRLDFMLAEREIVQLPALSVVDLPLLNPQSPRPVA
jgi:DNA polymerase III gamma/tau subunit